MTSPFNPLKPEHFQRLDESDDGEFYDVPRRVVHIDNAAIAAAARLYGELLPRNGRLLDLMSSWRSHLPDGFEAAEIIGLGMSAGEMADNPQLTSHVIADLNREPLLPFPDCHFDGALCTVSVQYLTRPLEVFREVRRVLQPGAPFVLTFSNRCFPTKAVAIWRAGGDQEHLRLLALYFGLGGGWRDFNTADCSAGPDYDP
ncbi:MAG: methyltransferase domain-containing protein, partial [Chloroflexota bacterium]